jgi:hypothetical protein
LIALGSLLTIIVVVSVILYPRVENQSSTPLPRMQAAVDVFTSKMVVNHEGDARNVLSAFHEEIFSGTLNLLRSREDLGGREGYLADILEGKGWLFGYAGVERREWRSDQYWVGPTSNELFVVVVPLVAKNAIWMVQGDDVMIVARKCQNPSEAGTTDQNGNIYCVSGVVETWKQAGWIKFLIDTQGVVYYGGTNPE